MRQFVPSDYVDKQGNVYETVGENIRNGKNGAVTSDFPTPEDIGGGLVGSDGKNYVTVLKNLGSTPQSNIYAIVNIEKNGIMSWAPVINIITDSNKNSYVTPSIKAVVDFIGKNTIIPTGFKKYAVAFQVNGGNITLNNIDNIPGLEIKLIGDHFVVKSSLNISFIEITSFTPLEPEVVILDTQIYFDETKLSARINTNKDGSYKLLLIAG